MTIEQLIHLKAEAIRQIAAANFIAAGSIFLVLSAISIASYIMYRKRPNCYTPYDLICGVSAVGAALFALTTICIGLEYITANAEAVKSIANHQMITLGK